MYVYLRLAGLGFSWLLATWFVYKFHTDEKYHNHPLIKKMFPVWLVCMVLLGSLFVHRVTHWYELT